MNSSETRSRGGSPARPAWQPAPHEVVERFEQIAAQFAGAERRKMFGYPCLFMNSSMVAGVHGSDTFLRMAPSDREAFLHLDGAHLLEPMPGRPVREYVVVPGWLLERPAELAKWIECARTYGAALPPKPRSGKPDPTR